MDFKKITNIVFDGIYENDYPDFCDACIVYAEIDGIELTEEQLDIVNSDGCFVHEKLMEYLF